MFRRVNLAINSSIDGSSCWFSWYNSVTYSVQVLLITPYCILALRQVGCVGGGVGVRGLVFTCHRQGYSANIPAVQILWVVC